MLERHAKLPTNKGPTFYLQPVHSATHADPCNNATGANPANGGRVSNYEFRRFRR